MWQLPQRLKSLKICILQSQMLTDAEKTRPNMVSASYLNYLPIFSHHQCSNEKGPLNQYTSVKFIKKYFNTCVIPEENHRTE